MSLAVRSARERRLAHASAIVERCRKCAIGSTRTQSVYGEGDPCADLMVVGEGPGETEDRLGRPFVGRAGELLDRMLLAIDLPRESVFICNTVKCRPTLEEGGKLRGKAGGGLREEDAILRALGAGDAWRDGGEVERESGGVLGFG